MAKLKLFNKLANLVCPDEITYYCDCNDGPQPTEQCSCCGRKCTLYVRSDKFTAIKNFMEELEKCE